MPQLNLPLLEIPDNRTVTSLVNKGLTPSVNLNNLNLFRPFGDDIVDLGIRFTEKRYEVIGEKEQTPDCADKCPEHMYWDCDEGRCKEYNSYKYGYLPTKYNIGKVRLEEPSGPTIFNFGYSGPPLIHAFSQGKYLLSGFTPSLTTTRSEFSVGYYPEAQFAPCEPTWGIDYTSSTPEVYSKATLGNSEDTLGVYKSTVSRWAGCPWNEALSSNVYETFDGHIANEIFNIYAKSRGVFALYLIEFTIDYKITIYGVK